MPTFRDSTGREYEASITLATAIKLQAAGVNMNKPMEIPDKWTSDLSSLGASLWLACEKSFVKHGFTEDTYAEILDGDTLASAMNALWDAVILFSQPPIRAALKKLWTAGANLTTAAAKQIDAAIDQISSESPGNSQASAE